MVAPVDQSRPPFWRYDLFADNYHFSTFHLSESNLRYYHEKLRYIRPIQIRGFPSAVYTLALFMQKRKLGGVTPKAIVTSAETLFPYQREVIERVFGCRIYDEFGANEMSIFATQCEEGNYHVNSEYSVVEFAPGPSGDDGTPEWLPICTSLINLSMPLIRYRMSDLVVRRNGLCPCGRNGQLLSSISGREDDYILTPDGRKVGHLCAFMKSAPVRELQVVQETADKLRLRIVPVSWQRSEEAAAAAVKAISERIGNRMSVVPELVNSIERTAGGKFRAVISKVGKSDGLDGQRA